MSNIIDYVKWRGDLTFTNDSFNTIDNFIFSELSYLPMEGMAAGIDEGEGISLKSLSDMFFRTHDYDEIDKKAVHVDRAPLLLYECAHSARFRDVMVTDFTNHVDSKTKSQFSAVTFILPDQTAFLAFRGTDHTIVGWEEDFNMSFLNETPGQREAAAYVRQQCKKFDAVRIGGHSKGGNFAVYGSAFAGPDCFDRILEVFSNDGPGFRDETMEKEDYKRILTKVTSIVPQDSMVGMILSNAFSHKIVKSTESGIEQHDLLSWQVEGRHLSEAHEFGLWSRIFNDTLKVWLKDIPDDDRETYVGILFNSITEASGSAYAAIPDVAKIVRIINRHLGERPKNQQKLFIDITGRLFLSGGRALAENLIPKG